MNLREAVYKSLSRDWKKSMNMAIKYDGCIGKSISVVNENVDGLRDWWSVRAGIWVSGQYLYGEPHDKNRPLAIMNGFVSNRKIIRVEEGTLYDECGHWKSEESEECLKVVNEVVFPWLDLNSDPLKLIEYFSGLVNYEGILHEKRQCLIARHGVFFELISGYPITIREKFHRELSVIYEYVGDIESSLNHLLLYKKYQEREYVPVKDKRLTEFQNGSKKLVEEGIDRLSALLGKA